MTELWDVASPALATAGLSACAVAGWLAWRAERRPATLAMALALFLIAFHRGYALFASWWLQEPQQPLSLVLDLVVGVLALVALWLLGRSPEATARAGRGRPPAWSALALGGLAMAAGLLIGSVAYVHSREALMHGLFVERLSLARSLAARVPEEAPRPLQVRIVRERWEDVQGRYPGTYLVLVGPDGVLELHTGQPVRVGRPAYDLRHGGGPSLERLLETREDWVGTFRSGQGEEEIGAFTFSPALDSVVAVRTPATRAWAEVRGALLPWSAAFGAVLGLLLPLSLLSLYGAFTSSRHEAMVAETALQTSVVQRQALFEQAMDGIFLLGDDRRVADANPAGCQLLGVPRERLVGRRLTDAVKVPELEDPEAAWQQLLDQGHLEGEYRVERPDGTTVQLEYRARARILPGLHLAMVRDVTARKQAEEEHRLLEESLERARRLESLGVLTGGIAHDFNNLLMTILGNTELAQETLPEESPARHALRRIATAGRRASDLTNQMLSYSGRSRVNAVPVHLGELVSRTVDSLASRIPGSIALLEDHQDGVPPVEGDPAQLAQVVTDLLDNAVEAIGEGPGRIEVRSRLVTLQEGDLADWELGAGLKPGPYVQLEVRDSGCGMSEEVRGKIFEPFFSTKFEGRGLGLAAALGVVRGHGGALQVESAPGQDTCLRILLPPAPVPEAPAPPAPASAGVVLVADDEENLLFLLSRTLAREGFEVLTARDGREALDHFRRSGPDLVAVVMDVKMPRMGGVDACLEMRALRPEVPVILSTGYAEETAEGLMEAGAAAVLHKPYRAADLVQAIRNAGNGRGG